MPERGRHYAACGLRVRSELALPCLGAARAGEPDVTVRYGAVRPALPRAVRTHGLWQAAPGDFLLNLHDSVRFRVTGGREIVVEPLDGADEGLIASLLTGSVWTALLQQRGLLTLHASVIGSGGGAVALLGPSGSGKSTLAAALAARGHAVLGDDVAAIGGNAGGPSLVLPGFPFLRLWADALDRLERPALPLRRVRADIEKYLLPVDCFPTGPRPLRAAYLLTSTNRQGIEFAALQPAEGLMWLRRNTHRWKFVDAFGHQRAHFHAIARIARDVPIVRVARPAEPFRLDALAERIESDLSGRCER